MILEKNEIIIWKTIFLKITIVPASGFMAKNAISHFRPGIQIDLAFCMAGLSPAKYF